MEDAGRQSVEVAAVSGVDEDSPGLEAAYKESVNETKLKTTRQGAETVPEGLVYWKQLNQPQIRR